MACVRPKVLFTSVPAPLKAEVERLVKLMGGELLGLHHSQYDNSCTHLLVVHEENSPTERILGALAAGIWIVNTQWVFDSHAAKRWLNEEKYECQLAHGLPLFHRKRASEARRGFIEGGGDPKVNSGGIFFGWTMFVYVEKSMNNRSFRRILMAGGAEVLKTEDLETAGINQTLNLVLTDLQKLPVIRELFGTETCVANHMYLRDVLLKGVSENKLSEYLFSADAELESKPLNMSDSQPTVVDISTPCKRAPSPRKRAPSPQSTSTRRPTMLHRRTRRTLGCVTNLVVIDDDEDVKPTLMGSVHSSVPVIEIDDLTPHGVKRRKLHYADEPATKPDQDIEVISDEDEKAASDGSVRSRRSKAVGSSNNNQVEVMEIDDDDDCQVVPGPVISQPVVTTSGLKIGSSIDLTMDSQGSNASYLSDVQVSSNSIEISVPEGNQPLSNSKLELVSNLSSQSTTPSSVLSPSSLKVGKPVEHNITNNGSHPKLNTKFSEDIDARRMSCGSDTRDKNGGMKNLKTTPHNGKIPKTAALHVIGNFLQQQSRSGELYACILNRKLYGIPVPDEIKSYTRELSKSETGLYWTSVKSTGLLGIDVSKLNSLSVLGHHTLGTSQACTHTKISSSGNCVNCNVRVDPVSRKNGGLGRGSVVDENDVDVVLNSLTWLKLGISNIFSANAEMIGDMLGRYVLKCGVPKIQSEALALGQHVVALRRGVEAVTSREYFCRLLHNLAAVTVSKECDAVPIGDTIWNIIDSIRELTGIPSLDDAETPICPSVTNLDTWQYRQNLYHLLGLVVDILHQDIASRPKNAVVEEFLAFKLLLGYSSNPTVLKKSAANIIKLWVSLRVGNLQTSYKFRALLTSVVSLVLETVWLWHSRRSDNLSSPGKKGSQCLDEELLLSLRGTPLATELAVMLRGVDMKSFARLVKELPLARHRAFVASFAPHNVEPSEGGKHWFELQYAIDNMKSNCKDRTDDADLQYKMELCRVQYHAYLQLTGAADIVNRSVNQTIKHNERLSEGNSNDGKRKIGDAENSNLTQRSCSELSFSSPVFEYYDFFDNLISNESLSMNYRRFSSDRAIIQSSKGELLKLNKECVRYISLLLKLLYIK